MRSVVNSIAPEAPQRSIPYYGGAQIAAQSLHQYPQAHVNLPLAKQLFESAQYSAGQSTNPSLNRKKTVVLCGNKEQQRAQLGRGEILFVKNNEAAKHFLNNHIAKEDPQWTKAPDVSIYPVQVSTLSALNYKLKTAEGRAYFNQDHSAQKLMETWKMGGAQIHNETDRSDDIGGDNRNGRTANAHNIATTQAGLCKLYNIWLDSRERLMTTLSTLYLLVREYPYESFGESLLEDPALKRQKLYDVGDAPPPSSFYWRFDPWFSSADRAGPPPELYRGRHEGGTSWKGDYVRVGTVHALFDNIKGGPEDLYSSSIEQFLFPTNSTAEYKGPVRNAEIPMLDVILGA